MNRLIPAVTAVLATLALTAAVPAALVVTYASSSQVTGGGTPTGDGGTPPADGGTPPADGGTPPSDGGTPPTDGGTTTTATTQYNYTVTFTPSVTGETLTSGNFLTLYDVGNVVASVSSSDFTTSSSFVGATPSQISPTDAADISNLTLTYTGTDLTAATTFTLTLTSPGLSTPQEGAFASNDSLFGSNLSLIGPIAVPGLVPEPVTLAVFAIGTGGLLMRRRRS